MRAIFVQDELISTGSSVAKYNELITLLANDMKLDMEQGFDMKGIRTVKSI